MGKIFEQIWKMQHELNLVIGKDTLNDPNKEEFLFMYCEALIDEIIELMECYELVFINSEKYEIININPKNAKIEAIDSLHFLISIFHILDIDLSNKNVDPFIYYYDNKKDMKRTHIYDHITEYLKIVNQIKNTTNWKWWSKSVKDDPTSQFKKIVKPQNVKVYAQNAFTTLMKIFYYLDMTPNDILNIYKQKCQINHDRQNSGYDIKTKTENDNLELETKI